MAVDERDLRSFQEVLAWVGRSRDESEWLQRALGVKAFVESHPRLREAAEAWARRPGRARTPAEREQHLHGA